MNIIDAIMGKNMAIEELTKKSTQNKKLWETDLQEYGDGITVFEAIGELTLEKGKTYVIQTDKATYKAVADVMADGVYMGNFAMLDGVVDADVPYLVVTGFDNGENIILAAFSDGSTYVTVSESETVHTIDPKYLPKGGVGYTETIKTAASVTLTSKNNLMDYVPISGRPVSLVEGRTYTVSVASDDPDAHLLLPTIECVCVDMSGGAGHALAIGNQALFDADESEDTGEWFMILEVFQEGEWTTAALWGIPSISATDSITVNVTSSTETVHAIDPMYMPVVEITSADYPAGEIHGTSVPLSEEESAQLSAFAKAKIPATIRVKLDAGEMGLLDVCVSFDYACVGGVAFMYLATFAGIDMVFGDEGNGQWYMGD